MCFIFSDPNYMAQNFSGNTFITMLSSLCHRHYGPFSDIIVVSEGARCPQLSPQPHSSPKLPLPALPVLGVWCAQTVQRSGPVTGPFPQHSPSGCICSRNQSLIPLGDHHDLFTHSSGPGPGFPSTLWRVGLLLRSPLLSSCVDVFFISLN